MKRKKNKTRPAQPNIIPTFSELLQNWDEFVAEEENADIHLKQQSERTELLSLPMARGSGICEAYEKKTGWRGSAILRQARQNGTHAYKWEKRMDEIATKKKKPEPQDTDGIKPAQKALKTASWARTMTKWMVTHSSKGGVKWQVVSFNGKSGQESAGIVDMIAIRKNHGVPEEGFRRGDLFEIILIQVKGGSAKFPSQADIDRLIEVQKYHRADKVVLAEWKKGEKLCCYLLPDTKNPIPASEIFGVAPSAKRIKSKLTDTVA